VTSDHFISGLKNPEELRFEQHLRPTRFEDFVGQGQIKENLRVYIGAAKQRREPLDHVLFSGPPGLGKTTLAYLIAGALGGGLHATTGPALDRPADLVGILTNLQAGDVLVLVGTHKQLDEAKVLLEAASATSSRA